MQRYKKLEITICDFKFFFESIRIGLKPHLQIYLHLRMQRFPDWTGVGGAFEHRFLGVGVVVFREGDDDVDLSDAAWVGSHCFRYLIGGTVDVEAFALCGDSHDGNHAACQCGTSQIGGGESLALAVVICRSVGDDGASRLQMRHLVAQVSFVCPFYCCHNYFLTLTFSVLIPFPVSILTM